MFLYTVYSNDTHQNGLAWIDLAWPVNTSVIRANKHTAHSHTDNIFDKVFTNFDANFLSFFRPTERQWLNHLQCMTKLLVSLFTKKISNSFT